MIGEYVDVDTFQINEKIQRPAEYQFESVVKCMDQAESLIGLKEGFKVLLYIINILANQSVN